MWISLQSSQWSIAFLITTIGPSRERVLGLVVFSAKHGLLLLGILEVFLLGPAFASFGVGNLSKRLSLS